MGEFLVFRLFILELILLVLFGIKVVVLYFKFEHMLLIVLLFINLINLLFILFGFSLFSSSKILLTEIFLLYLFSSLDKTLVFVIVL